MFPLFEETLNKYGAYLPLIIHEIICDVVDNDDNPKKQPVGLIKMQCVELLMLYIDLIKLKNDNFVIPNINNLCQSLLKMAFIHWYNFFFLKVVI